MGQTDDFAGKVEGGNRVRQRGVMSRPQIYKNTAPVQENYGESGVRPARVVQQYDSGPVFA